MKRLKSRKTFIKSCKRSYNMTNEFLLYIGASIIIIWGIAHIIPTKSIVEEFGEISEDNRRIITMEWLAEGITFIFIGILVIFVTAFGDFLDLTPSIVYLCSAGILLIMALLSLFTGARTSILPMKICPIIKFIVAILFIIATLVIEIP